MTETVLSYEELRAQNIARNQEFLTSIGISTRTRYHEQVDFNNTTNSTKKRKWMSSDEEDSGNRRRSSRIIALRASEETVAMEDKMNEIDGETKQPRKHKKDAQSQQIKDEEVFEDSTMKPSLSTIVRADPTPGSCREINADIDVFLDPIKSGVCSPIASYGKAAVMQQANHGKLPRFSKYSGVVEWKNCVFLWVNIVNDDASTYSNEFLEEGKFIRWFGGSKMTSDSPVIQRLLQCSSDESSIASDRVILFVRLQGGNYSCLGRLAWKSYNIQANPVTILWQLLDYDLIYRSDYFQSLLKFHKR